METVKILGIPFFNGSLEELFGALSSKGGVLTVPAAPALVNIPNDRLYYYSLLDSDFIVADSGYMVLLWNIFFKPSIRKLSGFAFIDFFLEQMDGSHDLVFTVNPTEIDQKININYLLSRNIHTSINDSYIAPFYEERVEDINLVGLIERRKPRWILINIGGGTQEKLGIYLKNKLTYSPAIICTGAALAFKTGRQVKVSKRIDNLYLGWLARILYNPKVFIPRYIKAIKLWQLIFKYKSSKIQLD